MSSACSYSTIPTSKEQISLRGSILRTLLQTENDRKLIDFWFRLAIALLGIVLVVATGVIGFIGWKTIADAKAAAEAAAKEAAKAKVQEILQEDRIQKLVRESANAMFAKGEFRQATEEQVRAQLPSAIATETGKRIPEQVNGELERRGLLYRMVSAQVAQEFGPQLHRFAGKKIEIYTTLLPEPSAFSDSIRKLFRANGLEAEIVYGGNSDHPTVVAPDDNLANILVDLLTRASGEQPQKLKAPEAFGTGIAAAIEIPERRPVKK